MDKTKQAALVRAGNAIKKRLPQDRGSFLGMAARFAARSAGWVAVLAILNLAAPYTGVKVAVSAVSALVCGALGVPGLGLILCASAMF